MSNKNKVAINVAYVEHCRRTRDTVYSVNAESMKLLNDIFALFNLMQPINENNYKQAWITLPRGHVMDWGFVDEEDACEYYEITDASKLQDKFEKEYPDDIYWYQVETISYNDTKILQLDGLRMEVRENSHLHQGAFELDFADLLNWIKTSLEAVLKECEQGTYNDRIEKELPYSLRYGTIPREKFWELYPCAKEQDLKDLTDAEIKRFISIIERENKDNIPAECIKDMTFNKYFRFAVAAHKNAGLKIKGDTLFKQFECHGEDFGGRILDGLDHDSTDDFYRYYKGEWREGGHPWGLRRGSSRTRIMLSPILTENGYYFVFSGNPHWNVYEIVKMYLELIKEGLPVVFSRPQETISFLKAEDLVGIVSERELPIYCQSRFHEKVDSFYHFDEEKDKKMKPFVKWYPVDKINLK